MSPFAHTLSRKLSESLFKNLVHLPDLSHETNTNILILLYICCVLYFEDPETVNPAIALAKGNNVLTHGKSFGGNTGLHNNAPGDLKPIRGNKYSRKESWHRDGWERQGNPKDQRLERRS